MEDEALPARQYPIALRVSTRSPTAMDSWAVPKALDLPAEVCSKPAGEFRPGPPSVLSVWGVTAQLFRLNRADRYSRLDRGIMKMGHRLEVDRT